MNRALPAVLIGGCVVLGLLNLLAYGYGRRELSPPAEPRTPWDRWQTLEIGARQQLTRLYHRYAGGADAREVFRRAETFADLPRARQDQLRNLCRAFYEILDSQRPDQQRELLRSPPRARAVFAYWHLREADPARLERLRRSAVEGLPQAHGADTGP